MEEAAWVGRVFHIDPIVHLDSDPFVREVRIAATVAAIRQATKED